MNKFNQFTLNKTLLKNLESLDYHTPTPVQVEVIPRVLSGKDLIAIAQTGTGKTAAFCLPILEILQKNEIKKGIKILVLVPTRELCQQIAHSFETYGKGLEFKTLALYGGVNQKPQVEILKSGVDILVATPGRLLDLMNQNLLRLNKIEVLVLDEADRMMDMGFQEELQDIISMLPTKRHGLFFSATMPGSVIRLSKAVLSSPDIIEVSPNSSASSEIEQKVYLCKREDKFQLLRKILKEVERDLVVIFTKTKNSADKVKEYLHSHRLASSLFHGDKSQEERERALAQFKEGSMKILIATDIAARGLDIEGISHVINFELPLEAENYVHRIGRTARGGKKGTAISLCESSELNALEKIQDLIQMKLTVEKFIGKPEASGKWSGEVVTKTSKAPTPGISQEKRGFIDHSKRQKLSPEGKSQAKNHPGFKKKKRK